VFYWDQQILYGKNEIMIPALVLMLTKNEDCNIRECIESVKQFSEVLVIDSNSSDSMKEIANFLGIGVIEFEWNSQYPKKRHWTLDQVSIKDKLLLFLDADEGM